MFTLVLLRMKKVDVVFCAVYYIHVYSYFRFHMRRSESILISKWMGVNTTRKIVVYSYFDVSLPVSLSESRFVIYQDCGAA